MGKLIDWNALAARARKTGLLAIEANADELQRLTELTPEQLVLALEQQGAKVDVVRDEAGEIQEITASVGVAEGEDENVVDSICASVTPAKILGDLAQTSVDVGLVSTTGTATNGSTSLTVAVPTGITAGMNVSGAGIAGGTTVSAISGSTVTLSTATTAVIAAGTPISFFTETQVIGLAEWTLSWKRKTADATTTDNNTYESSLPSTASWSVKAKYMFIDGDTSQANILGTITTVQQTTQTWNFFPTIGTGRSVFSGQAYVDGIDMATGMGKVVGLDVSLKGTGQLTFGTQGAPVATTNTQTGEQAEA